MPITMPAWGVWIKYGPFSATMVCFKASGPEKAGVGVMFAA